MNKNFVITLLILCLSAITFAQNSKGTLSGSNNENTQISWDKTKIDLGTLKQYNEKSVNFVFSNNGNRPIIIVDVISSCGCTSPEYTKAPVLPKQKGVISVVYDSESIGKFNKTVEIIFGADTPSQKLHIFGEVVE